MRNLSGAVAVITGAASGIGRALAVELSAAGAQLALADVDAIGLEETSHLCDTAGKTYAVDVSDATAMEHFANQVEKDFGKVSLLVNNAGVALRGTFAQTSLEDMDWLMNINFWGNVFGCRFFLPALLRQPEAHIVNMSSVFGLVGLPGQAAYAASKFAVRGFTEVLRHELRSTKVNVTSIHPGGVRTSIAANARPGLTVKSSAEEADVSFRKFAKTTPEVAARAILRGILKNKPRVVIGSDAFAFDALQRLMPAAASKIIVSIWDRMS
ncbi:SDR family oxidoreductase [Granulicella sp. dw_53]|uniref:SDR family NAD(P)-dependent oxidoreductase n=1 Tax=Granulicella sp. dw_53 TaxID=2719792 RepID=UPI001BD5C2D1|nr:SDR family oxidoreductase [Granulicella sp. dw_53]